MAAVGSLPDTAFGAADVDRVGICGMDGDRGNAPGIAVSRWLRANQRPVVGGIRSGAGLRSGNRLGPEPHPSYLLESAKASAARDVLVRKSANLVEPLPD